MLRLKTPILWPPEAKSWVILKDSDAGKDWGQEEKGTKEDEMVGWHHWLDGHGFGWTLGVGDGQGGLACCGSWDRRVRHDWATELNWICKINTVFIRNWFKNYWWWISGTLCYRKESRFKRLIIYTVWFHLYDIRRRQNFENQKTDGIFRDCVVR